MPSQEQAYEELVKGIWKENPVFIQLLGLCPALAVTNTAINAVAMSGATAFVLLGSSLLVSLMRNYIPKQVRITTFIIIIATFVTVADYTLLALAPDVHKELGAFIMLIVVNCLILGRQEAFASRNRTRVAMADAAGMVIGFAVALIMLGSVREILGYGTLFKIPVFGPSFEPWVIMILPPGAFLSLGLMLGVFAVIAESRKKARLAAQEGAGA
jgi:electron transport complex protein RnfE